MKTILVTGASSGFGKASALLFAQNGWKVIAWARRLSSMESWRAELSPEQQQNVHLSEVDVRDLSQVEGAFSSLPVAFSSVDVLLNNAGLAAGKDPVHQGNLDDWERMIDTNLKGLLYVTRTVSPHMVAQGSGHIINIGSIAGKEPYPDGNVYNATKFGVDGLTTGMRMDLAKHGIKVSQICPGMVETEFSQVRFHGDLEKAEAVYHNMTPLVANDIADLIWYMVQAPKHVNIADVLILPAEQASATIVSRKG
ncbi:MAG: NADP-dependent L-serine/L-allo-threonine dehydrogenase ydfG [Bacteroidota bacterium]|jgi:NADP-dependent 3-hydroxy acid dehydrogenase YdfG